jgi:hypothetical protein
MSYGYMNKELERLEEEIDGILKEAEQTDAEQDAALGEPSWRRVARGTEATRRSAGEDPGGQNSSGSRSQSAKGKKNNAVATPSKPSVRPRGENGEGKSQPP